MGAAGVGAGEGRGSHRRLSFNPSTSGNLLFNFVYKRY